MSPDKAVPLSDEDLATWKRQAEAGSDFGARPVPRLLATLDARVEAARREEEPKYVWVVSFSNYEPAEVDGIYATKEMADARAEELNDRDDGWGWDVHRWVVQG